MCENGLHAKTKNPPDVVSLEPEDTIHLAEIEIDLAGCCNLIGGYLYLPNQIWEIGFDFAKSIMP
jgi:hypothetical protein